MAVTVETLEKLERKITFSLPLEPIQSEVQNRLKKVARTVRMDGFRPGKVPMRVVAQRYGGATYYEVLNDKAGEAFFSAIKDADLRLAGQPNITEADGAPEGHIQLEAVFEILPEVVLGDLGTAQVQRLACTVDEAAIDKTLEILRQQRRTFSQRAQGDAAADGDRVTVDFEGKIDAQPFGDSKAEGFQLMLGTGQLLPAFDEAVRGMKVGESKTFTLTFPENYHADVAGKTADFTLAVKKIEAPRLPEITDAFAKSLGVQDATVQGLRADVRKNLEREVHARVRNLNKKAAMDALRERAELELPKASVQAENVRLQEAMRASLRERGLVKNPAELTFPEDMFLERAQDNVRLALIIAELVKAHQLQATPEQVKAKVQELAASYEKPQEVERWYFTDRERLAQVEAMVTENNVVEYVLGQVQVQDKAISFEELMQQGQEEDKPEEVATSAHEKEAAEDAAPKAPAAL